MALYDSLHDVILKLNSNEKPRNLRITIEEDKKNILGKTYSIRVTDDIDAVFLYSILLGEEDFNVLKAQQGLRADFDSFPNHLAKKLSDCITQPQQFYLILDAADFEDSFRTHDGCFMKIIERSDFKDTCVVRLRIAPGSEEDIRTLLCTKINLIQQKLTVTDNNCKQLRNENENYLQQLHEKDMKISELEVRLNEQVSKVAADFSQNLASERAKWEDNLQKIESRLKQQVTELENRVVLLDFKNSGLNNEKKELENTISIRSMKLDMAEKELQRSAETINKLLTESRILSEKIKDLNEKLVASVRLKSELEKDNLQIARILNDKDCELKLLQDGYKKLKLRVELIIREKQQLKEELRSANNSITEFKKELVYINAKKKDLLEVAELLEIQKEESEKELDKKTKFISDLEEKLEDVIKQLKDSRTNAEELTSRVTSQEREIKKQADVNAFLHRKLSECGSGLNNSAPDPPVNIARMHVSAQTSNRTLPPWLTASTPAAADEKGTNVEPFRKSNQSSAYFPTTFQNS